MALAIMFLDDEAEICEIYKDFLASPDIEVFTFSDPKEAIIFAGQRTLDLIFLDYRMPGTNGDKVAQSLSNPCPIFLVTGDINLETEYKFEQILSKPVDLDDLQILIEGYLKNKKSA
ncbi:MAG: response regulator [Bacteriovoracaceae bacterium]|nr:response regulator [Bacteriovoracaceae bacterium]